MDISAISAAITPAPAAAPTPIPSAASPTTQTTSTTPVDTITLSPAAQATLAGQTAPAVPPGGDVQQALSVLNDTSASVTDKLSTLALVSGRVASGSAFTGAGAMAADLGSALVDSSFSQHVQSLVSGISGHFRDGRNGAVTASSIEDALKAFDALSSDDQQAYVGALNIQSQATGGQNRYASVDAYRANQQAQAEVKRAIDAALANPAYASQIAKNTPEGLDTLHGPLAALSKLAQATGDQATAQLVSLAWAQQNSDAWTAKAQAYFAQYSPALAPTSGDEPSEPQTAQSAAGYSPPDSKTLMAALAAVNDTTGKTSLQDQVSAYQTLTDYVVNDHASGPARTAIVTNFGASPFLKRVTALEEAVHGSGDAPRGAIPAQTQLDRINRLGADDLQIDYALNSRNGKGETTFASIDSMKANYAARSSVDKPSAGILAKYGVHAFQQITDPSITRNPVYGQFLALARDAGEDTDAWTARAQKIVAELQPLLDAESSAATSPGPTPVEKAITILRASPPSASAAAIALAMLQRSSNSRTHTL